MVIYAETGRGACLRVAKSVDEGRRAILREVGTHDGVQVCQKATRENVEWVRGMGGYVPPEAKLIK